MTTQTLIAEGKLIEAENGKDYIIASNGKKIIRKWAGRTKTLWVVDDKAYATLWDAYQFNS